MVKECQISGLNPFSRLIRLDFVYVEGASFSTNTPRLACRWHQREILYSRLYSMLRSIEQPMPIKPAVPFTTYACIGLLYIFDLRPRLECLIVLQRFSFSLLFAFSSRRRRTADWHETLLKGNIHEDIRLYKEFTYRYKRIDKSCYKHTSGWNSWTGVCEILRIGVGYSHHWFWDKKKLCSCVSSITRNMIDWFDLNFVSLFLLL